MLVCVGTQCVPSVATCVVAKIYRPIFGESGLLENDITYPKTYPIFYHSKEARSPDLLWNHNHALQPGEFAPCWPNLKVQGSGSPSCASPCTRMHCLADAPRLVSALALPWHALRALPHSSRRAPSPCTRCSCWPRPPGAHVLPGCPHAPSLVGGAFLFAGAARPSHALHTDRLRSPALVAGEHRHQFLRRTTGLHLSCLAEESNERIPGHRARRRRERPNHTDHDARWANDDDDRAGWLWRGPAISGQHGAHGRSHDSRSGSGIGRARRVDRRLLERQWLRCALLPGRFLLQIHPLNANNQYVLEGAWCLYMCGWCPLAHFMHKGTRDASGQSLTDYSRNDMKDEHDPAGAKTELVGSLTSFDASKKTAAYDLRGTNPRAPRASERHVHLGRQGHDRDAEARRGVRSFLNDTRIRQELPY